jgi:hypothetical protein
MPVLHIGTTAGMGQAHEWRERADRVSTTPVTVCGAAANFRFVPAADASRASRSGYGLPRDNRNMITLPPQSRFNDGRDSRQFLF